MESYCSTQVTDPYQIFWDLSTMLFEVELKKIYVDSKWFWNLYSFFIVCNFRDLLYKIFDTYSVVEISISWIHLKSLETFLLRVLQPIFRYWFFFPFWFNESEWIPLDPETNFPISRDYLISFSANFGTKLTRDRVTNAISLWSHPLAPNLLISCKKFWQWTETRINMCY